MKIKLSTGVAGISLMMTATASANDLDHGETVAISVAAIQATGASKPPARTGGAAARRAAKRKQRSERVRAADARKAVTEEQKEVRRAARAAKKGTASSTADTSGDIVVTGTRIRANAGKTGAPVQSVSKEELKRRGLAHLEDVMNQLPQTAPVLGALRVDEQGGRAGVNLRGLGTGRTLVLINGQRATNDTNSIPAAMVERIDVLTGGASAVYGSDAVGGVVNYILKRNYTGITINGELQVIQHTNRLDEIRELIQLVNLPLPNKNAIGGPRGYVDISTGYNFDGGKGNISFNVGMNRTGNLLSTAYDNASCYIYGRQSYTAPPGSPNDYTQLACGLPATYNPYGRFDVWGQQQTGVNERGEPVYQAIEGARPGLYSNSVNGSKQFRQYSDTDIVPLITPGYVYRSDERYYGQVNLHYKFNDAIQYNATFRRVRFQNQSEFLDGATINTTSKMNCDNPYLSSQQARTLCGDKAGDPNTYSQVFISYHPQGWTDYFKYYFNETFVTNQISGKVTNDIRWEINANRNEHNDFWRQNAYYYDDYNGRAFTNAIRARSVNGQIVCLPPQDPYSTNPLVAEAQKAIDARCKPIDIFSSINPDQALINDVVVNMGSQAFYNTETLVNGTVAGTLGAYGIKSPWANEPIGFSLTAERRLNAFEQRSTGFNSTYILPFKTSTMTTEFAGELSLPIMQDKPFVRYMQINGAIRQGYYTSRGITQNATTWRVGSTWTPVNGVSFRGSFSSSLRVAIREAVDPQRVIQEPLFDPCSPQQQNSAVKRLTFEQCAATGVTRQQYDALSLRPVTDCNNGYCSANILVGGNPNLKPEKSTTVSVGATFTPSFIKNFDVSIDAYKIKVTGVFYDLNPYDAFNQCIKGLKFYCSIYNRNPVNGRLDAPGAFGDRRKANGGFADNRGVDFIANYRVNLLDLTDTDLGSIGFNFNGNLRLKNNFQGAPGLLPYDCIGYFGPFCGSQPRWRNTLRVIWATPWSNLSVNTLWRHASGQKWSGLSTNPTLKAKPNPFETGTRPESLLYYPDSNYFDLGFDIGVAKDSSLRLNISNIFDRRPHIVPGGWLGTEPGMYDALGRNITLGFTARF